jgi:polyvinyl alcohol dehydrogenase (cytochrome)
VFVQHCAACHMDSNATQPGEGRALTLTSLQQLPPEHVLDALVSGKMMSVGATLNAGERQAVAEWLGGRPLGTADSGDARHMANQCKTQEGALTPSARDWNGWGAGVANRRQADSSLSVDQVRTLALSWSFGFPGGAESYSQPTVVGGRVFVGSDNGYVYAIDAKSGCVHWSFQAKAGVRTAPSVAPVQSGKASQAVFFGDLKGYVYALDVLNGTLLWSTRVDDQPMVKVTGAPAVYGGRLYVGTTTGEEVTAAAPTYECCRTRGTVVALDTGSGHIVWKTYLVPDQPHPVGKNSAGTTMWAPAGVGVWVSPTIDTKRKLIYVTTGDAYTSPAAELSDSVVALDLRTGKVVWHHQDTPDDAWLAGCMPGKPFGNCPAKVGPDWDFGSSAMLLSNAGSDVLIAAHKGGYVVALDPGQKGRVLWRQLVATGTPGPGGEIVFGGASDGRNAYYGLNSGSVVALNVSTGKPDWRTAIEPAVPKRAGVSAALTGGRDVVFAGGWDGVLRALSTQDGKPVWTFNTAQEFQTANGVPAHGGSMGAPGATLAGGMLFVTSGYIGVGNGMPGNVLLAFAPGTSAAEHKGK